MSGNATGGTLGPRDVTTGLSEAVMEADAGIDDAVASDSGEMAVEQGKAPANVLHVDFGEKASDSEDPVIRDIAEAAEGVSGNTERIAVVTALSQTPGLTESAIAPDVLAKLLPDDVVVLPELKRVGGGLAYRFAKRAFDVVSCSCALVVLAIPMAAIAVAVKAESPGPVIYAQTRVGKGGKLFKIYKFRSMYTDAEAKGARWAAGDDPRITPLGKRLRMTRLDEIPQFWNAVKGDIPLRILKTRPEFSEKSMGAFALPAKSSTNKEEAFSQVASCFASGLRTCRISGFNCKRVGSMGGQFLAKPVFKAVCA